MFIPAAIAFSALFGLIIVRRELRKAPEGFEDERGFHLVRGRRLTPRRSYRLEPISSNLPKAPVY